ncbi:protein phosphatase 2C domain-containing protein [Streptomyces sp. NPDC002564]|uniref:protein phosphatase 2C domain-containing protein n=1 Tax=Streptomyces sp. NPDC002564 TaxID=3364649 RepID=UPI0036C6510D
MSQQGERSTGREDDWWGQLYDDAAPDTGPAPASDTLDDRFASASVTVREGLPAAREPHPAPPDATPPAPPPPRAAPDPAPTAAPTDGKIPPERAPGAENFAGADGTDPTDRPPADPPDIPAAPPGAPPERRTPAPHPPTFTAPPPWAPPPAAPRPVTSPAGEATGPGAAGPAGKRDAYSPPSTEEPRPAAPASHVPGPTAAPRPAAPPPPEPERAPWSQAPPAFVGDGPPTYEAEPTVLPPADPDDLGDLVADTVLDGARYGASTLRAASVRGDSARYRGEPRRDALLTARFGTGQDALVLVAMATGARATPGAHRAAAEACGWIGRAVGRSHRRLAEDIRAARRGDLKSGLHRLTDRSLGKLRARAADLGLEPDEYAASLRCLLLPADPQCRTRVFFGVGGGGLFRLRDGAWQDIEPRIADTTGEAVVGFGSLPQPQDADRLTMDLGITTPPSPYEPAPEPPRDPFRFRASVARPGDTLVLCSGGLAEPLRGEPELAEHLTRRWEKTAPPGLAAFLADIQVRVKGYADDRTAAAVWEA